MNGLQIDKIKNILKTIKYNKDHPLDNFNIEEALNGNHLIKKTEKDTFIYRNENSMKKEEKLKKNLISNLFSSNLEKTPKKTKNGISSNKIETSNFKIDLNKITMTNIKNNSTTETFLDRFKFISILGEGAFATVGKCYDFKHKRHCAIKFLLKKSNKNYQNFIEKEINIQSSMNHNSFVKIYEVQQNEDFVFIIMELMEGGSLKDFIVSCYYNDSNYFLTDLECSVIMKTLFEGLDYLHSMNFMHRDIKPGNLLKF